MRFQAGVAQGSLVQFVWDQQAGRLYFDADGTGLGAAVLVAVLTGLPTLVAGDLAVIA